MKQTLRLTFALCFFVPAMLQAQAPQSMVYQGVLVDAAGEPYADGTYSLTFKLFPTASGGTADWTESQNVTTVDGVFSVILGETVAFDYRDFEDALWLEVTQGTTTFPRQKLTSSPYAMGLRLPLRAEGSNGLLFGSALSIFNSATSGFNFGIVGGTASGDGIGVAGVNEESAGDGIGVYGLSETDTGRGVYGQSSNNSGVNYGVYGEVDSPDGFSGYFKDGRGVYVEKDDGVAIPAFAQSTDDLHVSSADAVIGLYGNNGGSWGGGVVLGELSSGLLVDKWAIARRTAAGGGALRFTYGLNADYATNAVMMAVHPNGGLSVGTTGVPFANGLLVQGESFFNNVLNISDAEVSGTLEIDNDIAYSSPQTRYFSIHARGFIEPRGNSAASSNHGGRALVCFSGLSNCSNTAGVYLPQGAIVTEVRAVFKDDEPSDNLSITLERVRLTDNTHTTMANLTSSGTPGDFAILTDSSISSATIDNANYAYYVRTNIPQIQTTFSIYNVRIAYTVSGPQ